MVRLLHPRTLLPMLIFFGVLTLGLRIDETWQAISTGKVPIPARAAESKPEAKSDAPAISTPAQADAKDNKEPAKPAAEAKQASSPPSLPAPEITAADETSPAEMEVLKQLASRRASLERRSHDLDTREALIKVAEQRVDQKIKEMQSIRVQLQTMVDQISGAQQTQLENLVKIYETMKPKEAARIFETLDMPILLGVIQRMKPKSTAPIMAEMAPEKAKELTVALTKEDQLPKAASAAAK